MSFFISCYYLGNVAKKKVLKWQLISVFVGIVALGIIIVGFVFNYVM